MIIKKTALTTLMPWCVSPRTNINNESSDAWRHAPGPAARSQVIAVIVGLLFSLTANAQNKQTTKGTNKIDTLPRDLEIQLALSALPSHLKDSATVYVLNPDKGFEVARKGTNGFHAFVARFPLIKQVPKLKCGSFLTSQKCRPKELFLKN